MAHRILLAEDEDDLRDLIREELQLENYEVCEARTGGSAIEVFKAQKPDLVITDIRMPNGSGVDLIRAIRETSFIPVILITGFHDFCEEEFKELNVSKVLYKPFRIKDLILSINALLQ